MQAHFCGLGNSGNDISYSVIVKFESRYSCLKVGCREKEGGNTRESMNDWLSRTWRDSGRVAGEAGEAGRQVAPSTQHSASTRPYLRAKLKTWVSSGQTSAFTCFSCRDPFVTLSGSQIKIFIKHGPRIQVIYSIWCSTEISWSEGKAGWIGVTRRNCEIPSEPLSRDWQGQVWVCVIVSF